MPVGDSVSKNKVGGLQGAKPEGDFLSPYTDAHVPSTPIDPHSHEHTCTHTYNASKAVAW